MKRTLADLQKQYARAVQEPSRRGPGGPGGPGGRRGGPRMTGKPKNMRGVITRLFSYIAKYKYLLILVFCLLLVTSITNVFATSLLRPIINSLVEADKTVQQRLAYLIQTLVLLGGVYLVGIASNYIQAKIMLKISQGSIEKLRNDLFDKLQTLPTRYFDKNTTGEVMSRFTNDVDNIDMMINQTLTSTFSGIVQLVATFVLMVTTNIWLTLIIVAFMPVFTFGGGLIAKHSGKYYKQQQAALGAMNGYIEETVNGIKVVKVFNHEDVCQEEFDLLNGDMRDKLFKAQFYGGIMGPIMHNFSLISYGLTAGVGGLLCLAGFCDVGSVGLFCSLNRNFSMPINQISQQMSTIFAALAGAERVFAVMDTDPEEPDKENAVTPDFKGEVVLENVTFGYNKDKTVLKNISLYAKEGQKIAFVGSTGAGKTTVTNLLNRFYDIEEGKITIDGIDIKDIKRDVLRQNIAMVLQDTHLFTGTVMENIRYGRLDATDEEVVEAAKTASAHSFIMRLSDGYNTVITGDGANLSQGQRQLLNIARAAISKAPILVLDEATSSVDTRTERHIEHGMERLMKNRTTFVIAHRLSTVRNANAIMVLENGEIIERGDHDDLLKMKGRYYELYTGVKELD